MLEQELILINFEFCVCGNVLLCIFMSVCVNALYKYIILWVSLKPSEMKWSVIICCVLNLLSGGTIWLTLPDTLCLTAVKVKWEVFYRISAFHSPPDRDASRRNRVQDKFWIRMLERRYLYVRWKRENEMSRGISQNIII